LPVRLFPYAVTDHTGSVTFHLSDDTAKSSVLANETSARAVEVQSVRLDDFHREIMNGASIDYLKIDVEGFDYHVLLGAEKLFKTQTIKVVQIECTQELREIRDFLLDNHYSLCRMLQTGALAPVLRDEALPHNLFAHPENFRPVVEPLPRCGGDPPEVASSLAGQERGLRGPRRIDLMLDRVRRKVALRAHDHHREKEKDQRRDHSKTPPGASAPGRITSIRMSQSLRYTNALPFPFTLTTDACSACGPHPTSSAGRPLPPSRRMRYEQPGLSL
jgi:hypothetical protein